ncbi:MULTISPECIES: hypothetical protein [unclassified Fibrobacter]|uniref:hypothetical protein n=1 Tax=unclassified Fibrobacter TaxID=2634177 RepID=UPI00091CE4D3|nr:MULTISPECIES: hypothetical protein [unclassified Fibrobacter]OWV08251.1 hypothetical protein B7993_01060 [Fibrobacter sp. UWH3]SHL20440.1 hypothetical protein SAMN05720765_11111 [Fibrobacter sp. UWH6]
MVLELINVFAQPYNEIDNAYAAAAYVVNNEANGLSFHVDEQVKEQRKQPNWIQSDKMKFPPAVSAYQKKYEKCDKNKADQEVKSLCIKMTPGQILFHGGVLSVDPSSSLVTLSEPLSTTLNPETARSEAVYKGKAYRSNVLHINILKIVNPDVRVYPFKPNLAMSQESEVLLEAGIQLKKIKDTVACTNYPVGDYDVSTYTELKKTVEAHIVEWEIV